MAANALRRAYAFHRDHSATIVGETAACAIALARAELAAHAAGVVYVWEPDDDADWSFVDTWPVADQRRWRGVDREREHYAEYCLLVRPCPEHGPDCPHSDVLASLYGIIDADNDYRRTVEAELALEAFEAIAEGLAPATIRADVEGC